MKIYDYMNQLILSGNREVDELGNGLHYVYSPLSVLAKIDINAEVLPVNKNAVAVIIQKGKTYSLYLVGGFAKSTVEESIELQTKSTSLKTIYKFYQDKILG